jgi:hypothetical protein
MHNPLRMPLLHKPETTHNQVRLLSLLPSASFPPPPKPKLQPRCRLLHNRPRTARQLRTPAQEMWGNSLLGSCLYLERPLLLQCLLTQRLLTHRLLTHRLLTHRLLPQYLRRLLLPREAAAWAQLTALMDSLLSASMGSLYLQVVLSIQLARKYPLMTITLLSHVIIPAQVSRGGWARDMVMVTTTFL